MSEPDENGVVWTVIQSRWGDRTPPLAVLSQLHRRLAEVYATYLEARSALIAWRRQLEASLPPDALNRDLKHVYFGRKAGHSPIQHQVKTTDLIARLTEDGPTADTLREGAIVLAFAAWEDDARGRLADVLGKQRDETKNDTFRDLGLYRNAIGHGGSIKGQPLVLPCLAKGERVKLSDGQFYELFRMLIEAVNQVGETYSGHRPPYSLDFDGWWGGPK